MDARESNQLTEGSGVKTEMAGGLLYRSCESFDELDACVHLQVETWGYADGDVIPRRMFLVAQKIGGQVIGAFDVGQTSDESGRRERDGIKHPAEEPGRGTGANLVAFAMALPGVRGGEVYLHSHMLAVKESYRDRGIGRRLKLLQREDALRKGLGRMEWTFDPLEIKNAFLNITRLGVVIRKYTPNFYGVSSSRLQAGLPTDRLHAEWWMDTARVHEVLEGRSPANPKIREVITVPKSTSEWKKPGGDWKRAMEIQAETRRYFQSAFARGLAVVAYELSAEGNGSFQLASWEDTESMLSSRISQH